jgi:spore germination protein GerM
MSRRAALVTGVLLVVVTGCGVPVADDPTVVADNNVPFGLLSSTSTTTTTAVPAAPAVPLTVCFYRDDVLQPTARQAAISGVGPALEALQAGPTRPEQRERLTSAIFDPAVLVSAQRAGGVAHIALGESFTLAGPTEQLRIIAQAVCTMTALPGIGQVAFDLAGAPVEIPRGDGSLTAAPVSRDDYAALLAPPR